MNKCILIILLAGMAHVQASYAQYGCTVQGTVLHYELHNSGSGRTTQEECVVTDVENRNDTLWVTLTHNTSLGESEGKNAQSLSRFAVSPDGNTTFFLMDRETETGNMNNLASMLSDSEHTDMSDKISLDGSIRFYLNDKMNSGEKLPAGKFVMKAEFMKISTSFSGTFQGTESIITPAGKFQCLKVKYYLKTKALFMSETTETTAWYAPAVGLVKREEKHGKKDAVLTRLLISLEKSQE